MLFTSDTCMISSFEYKKFKELPSNGMASKPSIAGSQVGYERGGPVTFFSHKSVGTPR